jgi:Protein of unknown function (DUF2442)
MSTLTIDLQGTKVQSVAATEDDLTVDLVDGRTIIVPLAWYPRLAHSTPEERNNWQLIGGGEGIHWPGLDEDISVENLIFGQPSGESQRSFKRWLEERSAHGKKSSAEPGKAEIQRHIQIRRRTRR